MLSQVYETEVLDLWHPKVARPSKEDKPSEVSVGGKGRGPGRTSAQRRVWGRGMGE